MPTSRQYSAIPLPIASWSNYDAPSMSEPPASKRARADDAPDMISTTFDGVSSSRTTRKPFPLTQCAVCGVSGRKYKCPTCAAVYCSAGCCAAHRSECVVTTTTAATLSSTVTQQVTQQPTPGCEDTGADSRRQAVLAGSALAHIRIDKALRAALRDSRLRTVLACIDSSQDRPRALAKARAQWGAPFQTFLDDMLIAVGSARRRIDGILEFTG